MKTLVRSLGLLLLPGTVVLAVDEGFSEHEPDAFVDRLELLSVVVFDGEYLFSVNDPKSDRRFWIGLGQSVAGLTVLAYEAERDLVTVRYGNVEKVLSLRPSRFREEGSSVLENSDANKERSEALMAAWEALAAMHLRREALPDDLPPKIRELADRAFTASEGLENCLVELEAAEENADDLEELLEKGRVQSEGYQFLYRHLERRADNQSVFEGEESVRIGRAVNRLLDLYDPSG